MGALCVVLVVLFQWLVSWSCCSGEAIVVIDGYTHIGTLTSGDTVRLGTQLILVCRVVGLPYGTPHNYTWTCPNGPCEVEGYYRRKIHNEHILAVNTTSTSDGERYTCYVTATGGTINKTFFSFGVDGGTVVHSYGRLIPHEFPIIDIEQISGSDGLGMITCTVSSGTAKFDKPGPGGLDGGRVTDTRNGATATLVVDPSTTRFKNKEGYCEDKDTNYFYLFIDDKDPQNPPLLTVNSATSTAVEYDVDENDRDTDDIIAGYEVYRSGVPMIGEYVNGGKHSTITISPVVPGAQYRITASALGHNERSNIPAVETVTTGGAIASSPSHLTQNSTIRIHFGLSSLRGTGSANSPSPPRLLFIVRIDNDGIELNWLPPTEPNGEVHYVLYYTPEGGTEQSIDTGSELTYYNLTGLERNRVYTNIAVQAVNSAGNSWRSAVIAQYNHPLPLPEAEATSSIPLPGDDMSPTSSFPLLSSEVSPTSSLPQPGNDMSPTSSLRQPGNDMSPTSSILQPGNDMSPTSSIPQPGNEMSPTSSLRHPGNDMSPTSSILQPGNDMSPTSSSLSLAKGDMSPSSPLPLPVNDMTLRQPTEDVSATSVGLELPVTSSTLLGMLTETGSEVSTPTQTVSLGDAETINDLPSVDSLDRNTIIGAVAGALGVLIVTLFLVCVMLLAIAAKPKRNRSFQVQSRSRDERSTTQLCMTSCSSLSYYDDTAAVAVAFKAISTDEDAPQKRWTASDTIYDDCTGDSYVSILNILDAKRAWRDQHLHSMDETMETYEEMDVPNLDTAWSQRDDPLYSLDETDMIVPKGIKSAQGGKSLCSLAEGWEDGDVFDGTFDDIEDLHDNSVPVKWLNGQPGGQPASQPDGQPGHEIDANMETLKKSATVATTDSIEEYYYECDEVYDDVKYVNEIYETIDEVASDGQPDERTENIRDKGREMETDGQSINEPAKQSIQAAKQPAKSSIRQPGQQLDKPTIKPSAKPLAKHPAKLLIRQPKKWSLLKPADLSMKQADKQTGELSVGQQAEKPDKQPDRQSIGLSLGKLPTGYQALRPPHALGDIPDQYTKLHCNQRHRALTLGRPLSRQYSSMREPSRRTGANGEARSPSHQYSEPSHITSTGGFGRPVLLQYSSMRELSRSTGAGIQARPPSHQSSQSTSADGVLQYMQYL